MAYFEATINAPLEDVTAFSQMIEGRSGLVVTRLTAAREGSGSNRAADRSLCFHENDCHTMLRARAAH